MGLNISMAVHVLSMKIVIIMCTYTVDIYGVLANILKYSTHALTVILIIVVNVSEVCTLSQMLCHALMQQD